MKILVKTCYHLIFVIMLVGVASTVWGGQRTRILQEVVGSTQRLQRLNGMPVVISEKNHTVLISPRDIMTGSDKIVYFSMVISNPGNVALDFSIDNVTIIANKTPLHLLSPDEVLAEERAFYGKEAYGISSDQENMLKPYVEEKMAQLRRKLLKSETIAPGGKIAGNLAVELPFGTAQFSFLVKIGGDIHRFDFNVGEF